jgi:DNA polymerase III delta subunit
MVYLFIGQDSFSKDSPLSSKDIQLKKIKEEFLPKDVEQFNLDILYAERLQLRDLQEKLLSIPVNSSKRIIVIKNAQELDQETEDFIAGWAKQVVKEIILLLDIEKQSKKEAFLKDIYQYAKLFRFKEASAQNTFNLTRQIEQRRPDSALKILEELLKEGERPERILGGLRYALENSSMSALEVKRRVKWLLECDIEIKTGKLKPVFALEKLIVKLCSFIQPFC